MKIEQIQCPACGADLEIPEGRDKFFCQYCGASIYVDDEIERKEYTIRHIDHHIETDEAEIEKARAEVELQKLELEQEKRNDKVFLIAILLIVFIGIGLFLMIHFMSAPLFAE